MISIQITDVKIFMNKLLASEAFDIFQLEEAVITTYNTFRIDGHLIKEFYQEKEEDTTFLEEYDCSLWKDMRPICFSLIKGKKTPLNFKFVLHLNPEQTVHLLTENNTSAQTLQLKAFVLNIKYDSSGLHCITATSLHTFLPDKTPDKIWDSAFRQFLTQQNIPFEET